MEVLDRRTALEEAFDSAQADAEGKEYTPPVHEEIEDTEEPSNIVPLEVEKDPGDVEAEAAAKTDKDRPRTKGVPLSERKAAAPKTGEVQPEVETTRAPSGAEKAPLAWGANRDALWAKVPSEIRGLISKREVEIQQGMSQAGRIRQVAEEYRQVIMPFENIIKSMGSTPKAAITDVMQTATMMITGTQAQKVAILSEMVDRYNVDLGELDKGLTAMIEGKKSGRTAPSNQPAQLDPRILEQLKPLFDLQQRLTTAEGQKHERLTQEAAEAVNSIASKKYYEDVRDDMADILEISAKRGVVLTIEQAYDKACQLHPEVSKLVQAERKAPANDPNRRRRAASTVRGAPGGAILNGAQDRRSVLEANWDAQT